MASKLMMMMMILTGAMPLDFTGGLPSPDSCPPPPRELLHGCIGNPGYTYGAPCSAEELATLSQTP